MAFPHLFSRRNTSLANQTLPSQSSAESAAKTLPPETAVQANAKMNEAPAESGLSALYALLDTNYETRGYEDALVNADTLYMQQNVEALRQQLLRTIRKTKLYYEDFIREIRFHIASRSRMGMVDTAEELSVKQQTAETHLQIVAEIEQELNAEKGAGQGVLLSYQRGFQNGLAAISHHTFLSKKF